MTTRFLTQPSDPWDGAEELAAALAEEARRIKETESVMGFGMTREPGSDVAGRGDEGGR